jgi:heme-degrading monooxygenase HmoA
MTVAISRFRVANDKRLEVAQAFVARPCLVDKVAGFISLEVFTHSADPATFYLLTRWTDLESFRRWHSSPAHHASHQGIPKDLKLDPSQTELLFLERIDDAGSAMACGVLDWPEMIAGFIAQTPGVCYVVADRSGRIQAASAGFFSALGMLNEDVIGASLFSFLTDGSRAALLSLIESGDRQTHTALTFYSSSGAPLNIECRLDVQPLGFALVGCAREPGAGTYMETLEDLNNRLVVETREKARQAKELDQVNRKLKGALDELESMYWHLRKIQEVLPICLECGKVKTDEGSWQTLIEYLKANSRFLSHGYCPDCYERKLAENT